MAKLTFPKLEKTDIEVRIGSFNKEKSKCTLLLYKTARVDANILDRVVGCFNWQKRFYELNGVIYCSLGIFNEERKEWVWKDDAGAETQVEKEKGTASDAFKRAGFAWGIGRELYTAPTIWVDNPNNYTDMEVESISYDDITNEITSVVIVAKDRTNNYEKVQLYPKGKKVAQTSEKATNNRYTNVSDIKVGDTFEVKATEESITKDQLEIIKTFVNKLAKERQEKFMQVIVSDGYGVGSLDMLNKKQAQEIINNYVK